MADVLIIVTIAALLLAAHAYPFQFFSRWFFMRRSEGSWLWTAVPGSHSFSMPSRIKNMSTWWGCRFFLWLWGWKKNHYFTYICPQQKNLAFEYFQRILWFWVSTQKCLHAIKLKNTHYFSHTSIAAAPLSECSVLVPVSLRPPPPTKPALIGQLSWAWAETAHYVFTSTPVVLLHGHLCWGHELLYISCAHVSVDWIF